MVRLNQNHIKQKLRSGLRLSTYLNKALPAAWYMFILSMSKVQCRDNLWGVSVIEKIYLMKGMLFEAM